jgi:sporulation protein YlmC with PRC-barrel domain
LYDCSVAGDPVAWRAIEKGWKVVDTDGNVVGYVDQVTGDLNEDIFNGITVGDGGTVLTRARYVPAEQVGAIREGEIALRLGAEEVASLKPFIEPVSKPLTSLLPEEDTPPGS